MLYNIAGIVIFNPQDGSLTLQESGDLVKLTLPASRLLEILLKAPHGLMEREVLLTEVWDKYGLRGSHNNLNQYVSILRRTLSAMGCDDIIQTVPKIGFRLNPDIVISVFSPPTNIEDTLRKEGIFSSPKTLKEALMQAYDKRHGIYGNTPLFVLFVFLVIMAGLIFQKRNEWSIREIHPIAGVTGKECKMFFLQNINESDRVKLQKNVMDILKENELQCTSDRLIFFDNYTSKNTSNLGRTLLAYCRLSDKHNIIDCKNFYYLDRRG